VFGADAFEQRCHVLVDRVIAVDGNSTPAPRGHFVSCIVD
jgi:hypothetical protein